MNGISFQSGIGVFLTTQREELQYYKGVWDRVSSLCFFNGIYSKDKINYSNISMSFETKNKEQVPAAVSER